MALREGGGGGAEPLRGGRRPVALGGVGCTSSKIKESSSVSTESRCSFPSSSSERAPDFLRAEALSGRGTTEALPGLLPRCPFVFFLLPPLVPDGDAAPEASAPGGLSPLELADPSRGDELDSGELADASAEPSGEEEAVSVLASDMRTHPITKCRPLVRCIETEIPRFLAPLGMKSATPGAHSGTMCAGGARNQHERQLDTHERTLSPQIADRTTSLTPPLCERRTR